MCFNSIVSLYAFFFGVIISSILWYQKKFNIVYFYCTIFTMQLLEYFGHISLKNNNKKLNQITTKLILLLLFLQPLLYLFIYRNYLNNKNILKYILLFYVISSILFYNYLTKNNYLYIEYLDRNCNQSFCRLSWSFFNKNLFYTLLFLLFYFSLFTCFVNKSDLIFKILILLLGLYFIYIFFIDKIRNINILSLFGSIWCLMCVIYGPYYLFH